MARKTLPSKPSALIRLAVSDLEKTETDTLDMIDMGSWVEPVTISVMVGSEEDGNIETIDPSKKLAKLLPKIPKNGICAVCFAGAVMRRSLKVAGDVSCEPEEVADLMGDETIKNRLHALNYFRAGEIRSAFEFMHDLQQGSDLPEREHRAVKVLGNQIAVAIYDDSPVKFKRDMRKLATTLEKLGL